ncbi:DUF1806 family protein [Texcoconibacillus texcoconensis]|uniref:DUF1806 family protein n=1 Tax=Texcoconibacillus texcoconensis TaxID=1095777 RepID=A0A840QS91_9BACI|nr:hypothetical protein [Texcoconibacillus texcoconensis]
MKPIDKDLVQQQLNQRSNRPQYIHVETTNGAYASHKNESFFSAGAFLRNVELQYTIGKITGSGPYRVGLKLDGGWVYAEGLTDWTVDEEDRLLLAGHDHDGKLAVALQLSATPFRN